MTASGAETTVKELLNILYTTKTNSRPLPGYEDGFDGESRFIAGMDCDMVYPNIYIGDVGSVKNKDYLKKLGITHVLNTAEGKRFGMVDTDEGFYKDVGIKYLGLQLLDLPMTNIAEHFNTAADFMHDGIQSGGKVFVNCLMGMSRSSTCVLAYLMIKEQLSATEALKTVKEHRDVRPNDGFLRQLVDLDNKLKQERSAKL